MIFPKVVHRPTLGRSNKWFKANLSHLCPRRLQRVLLGATFQHLRAQMLWFLPCASGSGRAAVGLQRDRVDSVRFPVVVVTMQ